MKCIEPNINLNDLKHNKKRVINIVLQNENYVSYKESKGFKTNSYKNVSIACDRTQKPMAHFKKLKQKLNIKNVGRETNKTKKTLPE